MAHFCVLLTMPDCYFISIRKCAVYGGKWIEGHAAPPPKSQFRGQGIHTSNSLHDLRDASLKNTSGPSFELRTSNYASFELRNSNYVTLHTHWPKCSHSNDP